MNDSLPAALPMAWRPHLLALGVAVLAILLLFAPDAADMARIWWTSSTYGHCLFVLPIVAWLVWERRQVAARLAPKAWLGGLVVVGLASCLWLVGDAASVSLFRHAALVGMIQGAILTVLGRDVLQSLLFPVSYLVFLIPFGDEIMPFMQRVTADIVMSLLSLVGLPAKNDGVLITTADGWFEVAEACSGVKFLVAMVAFGTLVAYLCFRSAKRRIAFVLACIAISILANGVRAFATIYAARLTDIETATGFDHIVYGWIFFAVTMGGAFLLGRPFFEREEDTRTEILVADTVSSNRFPAAAMIGTIGVPAAALAWTLVSAAHSTVPLPNQITLPDVAGWKRATVGSDPHWTPRFDGADQVLLGRYGNGDGKAVDLGIALYGSPHASETVAGSVNPAPDPSGPWRRVGTSNEGQAVQMRGPGGVRRRATTFYVMDGRVISDVMTAKMRSAWNHLLARRSPVGVFVVSAVEPGAEQTISSFVRALGPLERRTDELLATARR